MKFHFSWLVITLTYGIRASERSLLLPTQKAGPDKVKSSQLQYSPSRFLFRSTCIPAALFYQDTYFWVLTDTINIYTILQNKRRRWPPPIIFELQILPQQTIYRWKGNLTATRIHFKYWKNILISRLYEQFSRNDSAIAPQWVSEKFQTFTI